MFRKFIKINNIQHPFLTTSLITSLLLALIPCLTFIIEAEHEKCFGLIFILPAILVAFITFCAYKFFDKRPLLTKIISGTLNSIIIIFIQIIYGTILFFILAMIESDYAYSNPKDYTKALNSICYQEYIQHFPKRIPDQATDILLYKTSCIFRGREEIILKFKIDKKYIDKELSMYSYKYIESPQNRNYRHNSFDFSLNMDKFTLYIINDYISKKRNEIGPYHYGIAVNYKTNEIAFYYIN